MLLQRKMCESFWSLCPIDSIRLISFTYPFLEISFDTVIVLKFTNDIEVFCWCYKREITFRLISCIFQKRWIWIITSNSKICVKKLKCKSYIFRFSGIQFTEFCQHSLFGNLVVCHLTFSEWPRGWFTQCYKNRISRNTVKKI